MRNVCIVGYGAIGPVHAEALESVENAHLYAVCDIDSQKLDLCKTKYDVKTYNDFDTMLCDCDIDTIHICTPHYLHFEMIKKALEKGKFVVCEKPVTMTKDEYMQLLNLKNSDRVCVVLQNRLNPCVIKIRELIQSGEMGKIKTIKGIMAWQRTEEYYRSGDWRGKWATEGGGVLINQAVHSLDYFSYLAGNIKSVKATMTNYSLSDVIEVEDTFSGYLTFDSGITGLFFASNAYGDSTMPEFEIIFENGRLRYLDSMLYRDGEIICTDKKAETGKIVWGAGHTQLLKEYYENGEYFTPKDAENTMLTMFAMYESAKNNGKEVNIGRE